MIVLERFCIFRSLEGFVQPFLQHASWQPAPQLGCSSLIPAPMHRRAPRLRVSWGKVHRWGARGHTASPAPREQTSRGLSITALPTGPFVIRKSLSKLQVGVLGENGTCDSNVTTWKILQLDGLVPECHDWKPSGCKSEWTNEWMTKSINQ